MEPTGPAFLMYIRDGYSFRNTIGTIKNETEYATMFLSRDAIKISFMNTSRHAVHAVHFNVREFDQYDYNITDESGQLVDQHHMVFETNEMFNTTKSIGRRDALRIYWYANESRINIQHIKTTNKDPGRVAALFVKILPIEPRQYDTNCQYSAEPNIRVQAKDFSDICGLASALKCTNLEIHGQSSTVTFKGLLANQTVAFVHRYASHNRSTVEQVPPSNVGPNNIREIDNLLENIRLQEASVSKDSAQRISLNVVNKEDIIKVKIPVCTVKSLSKIHNISPTGTLLRFYFGKDLPIKLESTIGTYGSYTIYLRSGN